MQFQSLLQKTKLLALALGMSFSLLVQAEIDSSSKAIVLQQVQSHYKKVLKFEFDHKAEKNGRIGYSRNGYIINSLLWKYRQATAQLSSEFNDLLAGQELEAGKEDFIQKQLTFLQAQIAQLAQEMNRQKKSSDDLLALDELRQDLNELIETTQRRFAILQDVQDLDDVTGLSSKDLYFDIARQACIAVSAPGDILLTHPWTEDGRGDFEGLRPYIKLLEALKFSDLGLSYRHAELATSMDFENYDIQSVSFYPPSFNEKKPVELRMPTFLYLRNSHPQALLYRNNFSVFRVQGMSSKAETRKREKALEKASHTENFRIKNTTCADFVNWSFGNQITSAWNFIPGVKLAVEALYLPEHIQTPDDLADSPMTRKVCEIRNGQLISPSRKLVRPWIKEIQADRQSTNEAIRTKAEKMFKKLVREGLIDQDGNALVEVANLKLKQAKY